MEPEFVRKSLSQRYEITNRASCRVYVSLHSKLRIQTLYIFYGEEETLFHVRMLAEILQQFSCISTNIGKRHWVSFVSQKQTPLEDTNNVSASRRIRSLLWCKALGTQHPSRVVQLLLDLSQARGINDKHELHSSCNVVSDNICI